jgi:hypothetical protein
MPQPRQEASTILKRESSRFPFWNPICQGPSFGLAFRTVKRHAFATPCTGTGLAKAAASCHCYFIGFSLHGLLPDAHRRPALHSSHRAAPGSCHAHGCCAIRLSPSPLPKRPRSLQAQISSDARAGSRGWIRGAIPRSQIAGVFQFVNRLPRRDPEPQQRNILGFTSVLLIPPGPLLSQATSMATPRA